MSQLFTNNASSILVEDLLTAATTVNLGPGEGDQFPLPDAGDPNSYAILTLEDVNGNFEIVKLTERTGDLLTIDRAQEGTASAGFATGSRIECRLTAGALGGFKQVADQFDLRGDYIDSDGMRLWHEQDPSTYQFFSLRYYTLDVFGTPALRITGPAGIGGLGIYLECVASDGSFRNASLTPDYNNDNPFPGTGELMWTVPGQLQWSTISQPLGKPKMLSSWEYDTNTATYKLQFAANKTNPVSFEFRPRDEFEEEYVVTINKDGSFTARNFLAIKNSREATYTDSLPLRIYNIPNIFVPGNGDWITFQREDHNNVNRELAYVFNCRYLESTNPNVWDTRSVYIREDGGVQTDPNTVIDDDNQLVTKAYVDAATGNLSGGSGTNALAASIYGRSALWSDAAGTNDGSVKTLSSSQAFSDFYEIEVTAKYGSGKFVSMRIDTQTLADKGYTSQWILLESGDTGQDNRLVYFEPKSDTTFAATQQNASSGYVVRVVGLFPKNPGGV